MNRDKFTIEIEREDDGRWIAEIADVPGAMAYGETIEEAKAKASEIANASRKEDERKRFEEWAREYLKSAESNVGYCYEALWDSWRAATRNGES